MSNLRHTAVHKGGIHPLGRNGGGDVGVGSATLKSQEQPRGRLNAVGCDSKPGDRLSWGHQVAAGCGSTD